MELDYRPAGWDNEKKIGILHENLINVKPSDSYSEVIPKPVLRRVIGIQIKLKEAWFVCDFWCLDCRSGSGTSG